MIPCTKNLEQLFFYLDVGREDIRKIFVIFKSLIDVEVPQNIKPEYQALIRSNTTKLINISSNLCYPF